MRFEQLEYLIAVNNHKSMHAAAEELHVSQPCISKALKDLEDELNTQIIIRKTTGSYLTEQGYKLLPHAIKIMNEANILRELCDISNESNISKDTLKLIASNNIFHCFDDFTSIFNSKYDTVLNITEMDSQDLLRILKQSEQPELAFIQLPFSMLEDEETIRQTYSCNLIRNERLRVSMSKDSKYSQYSSISLKTVSELPLIAYASSSDDLSIFPKFLQNSGIKLNVKYITNSISAATKYGKNYDTYALGTKTNLMTSSTPERCSVPIKEKIMIATCLLVRKDNLSDVSAKFANEFLNAYKTTKLF